MAQFRTRSVVTSGLGPIWAGIIFFLFGLVFFLIGAWYIYDAALYLRDGRVATGTVLGKKLHQASDTSDTTYEIQYGFEADRELLQGHATVDADQWDKLKKGDSISIEYVARAPRINRLLGESYWFAALFSVIGLVFCPLGAAISIKALRSSHDRKSDNDRTIEVIRPIRPPLLDAIVNPALVFGLTILFIGVIMLPLSISAVRREHAFSAAGKVTTGIVLAKSVHTQTHQHNHDRSYIVRYRFTAGDGKLFEDSQEVSYRRWHSIHERDPVEILYMRDRPSVSRLSGGHPIVGFWLAAILGGLFILVGAPLLTCGVFTAAKDYRRKTRR